MTCCSLIYQFNFPTLLILTAQPDIAYSLFSDKGRAWIGILAVFSVVKTDTESVVCCNAVSNVYNLTSFSLSSSVVYSKVLYSLKFRFAHRFLKTHGHILHHQ